ncbi:MAG TPA: nicotinate-nucleotide adenylyltransferase [Bacteroidota bacterium]|jgi:nicotinate-nucleotide adenylyltransferase|nr:nicotinate-nucleotide adenylyltransferase [Bacteroidota bacterium]
MKLGIFGGSFNPPHVGHLIVAESVRDQMQFDRIIFIPSANPPNKHDRTMAPAADRLQMTRLAVEGNNHFEVSDIETQRGGISYTIDTVTSLVGLHPNGDLSLIIGADNLLEFQTWKSPDEILSKVNLVAMSRPGFSPHDQHGKYARFVSFVNVPQIGISGTEIRRRVKSGRTIRYMVPPSVHEYIARRGLYKDPV